MRRPIAPKHLVFIKNLVHQKTENKIEKSFFYQELWLFENNTQIFNFYSKNAHVNKLWKPGN